MEGRILEPPLEELVRIKIAYLNRRLFWQGFRYGSVMRKGLTEDKVAQVENYEDNRVFTTREKGAIRYAENLAVDYDAIDNDEFLVSLQQYFSDAQMSS